MRPPAQASHRWQLWLGWVAATLAGGVAGALPGAAASAISGEGAGSGEVWVTLLAMPALMAAAQWLMVRRRLAGDEDWREEDATLRWRVAASAGCILAVSVALHGTSASSALADVLSWYAPVALFAGFLSASAQNEVLAAAFGWPASRRFLPLTVLGWTIAWPLWIAGVAAGRMPWMVGLAWTCAPAAVIGALSGIALVTVAHPPQSSVRLIAVIGPFPRGGTDVTQPQEHEREIGSPAR